MDDAQAFLDSFELRLSRKQKELENLLFASGARFNRDVLRPFLSQYSLTFDVFQGRYSFYSSPEGKIVDPFKFRGKKRIAFASIKKVLDTYIDHHHRFCDFIL